MFRKATVPAAILVTAIALAACGGSNSPTNSNSASTHTRTGNGLKMAECIRTHGVPNFPDPGNGPNSIQASRNGSGGGSVSVDGVQLNVSAQTLQKAMSACQRYAPQGPPISGSQLTKLRQGAVKMAECMRSHGVPNFSDPQVTAGPGGKGIAVRIGGPPSSSGGGQHLDPTSPAFRKALKTCGGLMRVGPKAQKLAGS